MVDISKQIAYWRNSAEEDWAVARDLVQDGRIRHGLFFVHLALEKALKALVCRHTKELAAEGPQSAAARRTGGTFALGRFTRRSWRR